MARCVALFFVPVAVHAAMITGTVIGEGAQPVWSPDGARIAYVRTGPGSALRLMTARADGTDAQTLVDADGVYPFVRSPAWSPDGRSIAFVRGFGGIAGELWIVPSAGGAPRRLTNDPPNTYSDEPMFTHDGRAIVHASNRGGATNIWMLPLDGGAAVRLTTGPGPDETPTIDQMGIDLTAAAIRRSVP